MSFFSIRRVFISRWWWSYIPRGGVWRPFPAHRPTPRQSRPHHGRGGGDSDLRGPRQALPLRHRVAAVEGAWSRRHEDHALARDRRVPDRDATRPNTQGTCIVTRQDNNNTYLFITRTHLPKDTRGARSKNKLQTVFINKTLWYNHLK